LVQRNTSQAKVVRLAGYRFEPILNGGRVTPHLYNKEKLNGLDLFSGIGGITEALSPWITPTIYCENEVYAQSVLLSRMQRGELPIAPIWDDIKTLPAWELPEIDICYGGFPCQDISVAGNGVGLGGERSGLFFEVMRVAQEARPAFLFLENVPAIRTRGQREVAKELARCGYDARWCVVSAREVGANHLRKRWFCLAYSDRDYLWKQSRRLSGASRKEERVFRVDGEKQFVANPEGNRDTRDANRVGDAFKQDKEQNVWPEFDGKSSNPRRDRGRKQLNSKRTLYENMANTNGERLRGQTETTKKENNEREWKNNGWTETTPYQRSWWEIEPDVGRVVNGLPHRRDRIKCLGNAVVPLQVCVAFQRLMGIERGNTEKVINKKESSVITEVETFNQQEGV
jgi:DNA (cytosine-5)-methyltransferase 1